MTTERMTRLDEETLETKDKAWMIVTKTISFSGLYHSGSHRKFLIYRDYWTTIRPEPVATFYTMSDARHHITTQREQA